MKVVRLHGPKRLRIHDEKIPVPDTEQALVRVRAVGLCGSDIHWYSEAGIGDARLSETLVLGHEFSGVIEDGPDQGRLAAIDPAITCDECEFCRDGNPNLCPNVQFAGHDVNDGALREFVAWPSSLIFPLPESLTPSDGAMLEPLGVALHAHDLGPVVPGMEIGVFGCGPIGLLLIQLARLSGASRIVATDPLGHRLEAARGMGATEVVEAAKGEEVSEVLAQNKGRGLDIVFEAAGENDAVEAAVHAARAGGKVILLGIPVDDRMSFSSNEARRKGLTIKLVRRMRNVYPRAIKLAEMGQVDLGSLVSHQFPISQINEAFRIATDRSGLKVVVVP